jgi:anti-anti-sigma factor
MENLSYMNSSGLNTLIQLLTKARVAGGEAVLCNMNKKINELILITKLNLLFKVTQTSDEAIKLLEV